MTTRQYFLIGTTVDITTD